MAFCHHADARCGPFQRTLQISVFVAFQYHAQSIQTNEITLRQYYSTYGTNDHLLTTYIRHHTGSMCACCIQTKGGHTLLAVPL